MNWCYQVILVFVSVNMFIWWGSYLLPTDSPIYTNMTEVSSVPYNVLGGFFNVDTTPDNTDWLDPNEDQLDTAVTTESEESTPITSSQLGAYLSGNTVIGYIGGLLNLIGGFFGGTYALLVGLGIPTPFAAMIGGLWDLMFLMAIAALITGRGI